MSSTPRIEGLARRHKPLLSRFENQHVELADYLRRWALPHHERDRLSRTRIALDVVDGRERVIGYHSLAAASIEHGTLVSTHFASLPKFPLPAILLARLAVDTGAQGQGLGRYLFEDALARAVEVGEIVGVRLLVTDAKDDAAVEFYRHIGMFALGDGFPCRMVLDLRTTVARGS